MGETRKKRGGRRSIVQKGLHSFERIRCGLHVKVGRGGGGGRIVGRRNENKLPGWVGSREKERERERRKLGRVKVRFDKWRVIKACNVH